MKSQFLRVSFVLLSLGVCTFASAHPGHGSGAMAGVMHPLLGLDHLLAMLAVGVWAAQLGGRAKWVVPISFVAVMALAGVAAMTGFTLSMVESGIATSVLLLGLMIAFSVKLKPAMGAAMVGVFAVFHGYSHGLEIPVFVSPWEYGIGFLMTTATLHGLGLLVGTGLQTRIFFSRAVGGVIATSGIWMTVSLV